MSLQFKLITKSRREFTLSMEQEIKIRELLDDKDIQFIRINGETVNKTSIDTIEKDFSNCEF